MSLCAARVSGEDARVRKKRFSRHPSVPLIPAPRAARLTSFSPRPDPFIGIHLTEKGLDYLENYMARSAWSLIGYEIPLAIDHAGHIPVEDCLKLAKRLERFNLAWMEDPVPGNDRPVCQARQCDEPVPWLTQARIPT